jgi:hypothetical protein
MFPALTLLLFLLSTTTTSQRTPNAYQYQLILDEQRCANIDYAMTNYEHCGLTSARLAASVAGATDVDVQSMTKDSNGMLLYEVRFINYK